jgi:putative DNA primase/helicase
MSALADRRAGQWPHILLVLGILNGKALKGRDAPCPLCGGKDRFRFSDKGRGLWFCHGGGGVGCGGGDGVKLVMLVTGRDFIGAMKLIERVIGPGGHGHGGGCGGGNGAPFPRNGGGANGVTRDPLKSWLDAYVDVFATTVDLYHRGRGVALTPAEALSLRFHPALFHWPTQGKWPAQIALVTRFDGTPVTCHQTFLKVDGSGKAPLEKPKLFPSGANPTGGGVWFGNVDANHEFIVAEGVESTLSAMRLYGAMAGCAALSCGGVRALILPPTARKVRVFADHDELGQGIAAAKDAARRWLAEGRSVTVTMASEPGEDANDILLRRLRAMS